MLLEKQAAPAGATLLIYGIFAAESQAQDRFLINCPKDEAFKIAMDWAHWKIDGRIVRAFINKSGESIKWLEDKGLLFDNIPPLYNYFDLRTFHCTGHLETGREVSRVLRKRCEELGVQMLFHCQARKILTGSNGEVLGVLAATKERNVKVDAKSVIIATGGYGGNKELLKKYHPTYSEKMFYSGPLYLTGDGLLMAKEIGAASVDPGTLLLSQHVPESIHTHSSINAISHDFNTLWVNKYGERFTSERNPDHANAVYAQPDKCLYSLFDEKFKNTFIAGHYDAAGHYKDEKSLNDELPSRVAKGIAKVANSWGEIAAWMGVPADVLTATIEEYNSACDRGYDEIFNKDRRYLQALRTPPYYAVRSFQDFHDAMGSIKINHRMEVINEHDKTIPGLYAAGNSAGGWVADSYCIKLSGYAFGFALNSGRIAGENAVKYVNG